MDSLVSSLCPEMKPSLLVFLDEFDNGQYDSNEQKIRDRNKGVISPPSPKENLKFIFNMRTKKIRRSQDDDVRMSASPTDDPARPSSANSPLDFCREFQSPGLKSVRCSNTEDSIWNNSALLAVCHRPEERPLVELPTLSDGVEQKMWKRHDHEEGKLLSENVVTFRSDNLIPMVDVLTCDEELASPLPILPEKEKDYEIDHRTTIHQKVRKSNATMAERPVPKIPIFPSEHRESTTPKRCGETSGGNLHLGKRLSTEGQAVIARFSTPEKITKRAMSLSEVDRARVGEMARNRENQTRGHPVSTEIEPVSRRLVDEPLPSFPIAEMVQITNMMENEVAALKADTVGRRDGRPREQERHPLGAEYYPL